MTTPFDNILTFEQGKLTDAEIILLFSDLIDSGDIWKLPPLYMDAAASLILSGKLTYKHNHKVN